MRDPLSSQIWKSHEIKTSWSDPSGQQRSSSVAGNADLKVAMMRRWRKRRRTRFRSIGLAIPTLTGTAEVTSNSVLWQADKEISGGFCRNLAQRCTSFFHIPPVPVSRFITASITTAGLALATASTPAEELLQPLRNALFSSTALHLHGPIPERVTQW
jgi:hypothetical protein